MSKVGKVLNRIGLASLLLLLTASLILPSVKISAAALSPKTVLIMGDSLMYESRINVVNQLAKTPEWKSYVHSYPGIALCDLLSWLPTDLTTYRPSMIVLETAGNFTRPCMLDANGNQLPDGSQAYFDKYTADMTSFFNLATASGAQVLFVNGPPWKDATRNNSVTKINSIATQLAANYAGKVKVTAVPRNAVSNNGKYTDYKACQSSETPAMGCGAVVAKQIAIRTTSGLQAGVHFCPNGLQSDFSCNIYSSGENRFGTSVAKEIVGNYITNVVTYGNTLTWESQTNIRAMASKKSNFNITIRSYPNTGLCTWNNWILSDIPAYHPDVIGIATMSMPPDPTGADTTCGTDSSGNVLILGSPEYYAAFQTNLAKFFQTAQSYNIPVVYFESIPVKDPTRNAVITQQNTIAQSLAKQYHGIAYSKTIKNALSTSGKYTDYKTCLSTETAAMGCGANVAGQIAIRTLTAPIQAGNHLCPGGLPDASPWQCSTYSSGEYRFAQTLVNTLYNPPAPLVP